MYRRNRDASELLRRAEKAELSRDVMRKRGDVRRQKNARALASQMARALHRNRRLAGAGRPGDLHRSLPSALDERTLTWMQKRNPSLEGRSQGCLQVALVIHD